MLRRVETDEELDAILDQHMEGEHEELNHLDCVFCAIGLSAEFTSTDIDTAAARLRSTIRKLTQLVHRKGLKVDDAI